MVATETQRKSLIDALIAESLSYNINVGYYSTKYDRTQVLCKDADRTVFTFKKHCREFEYVVDWNHGIRDERSLIRYIIDKALAYFGYVRGSAKGICKAIPTHLEVDLSKHIEKVMFNPPATIVFWKDGTKTVVKADGEDYDPEKGMAMAFSRKLLGDRGSYYNVFERWLKEWDKEPPVKSHAEEIMDTFRSLKDAFKKYLNDGNIKTTTNPLNGNPLLSVEKEAEERPELNVVSETCEKCYEEARKHDLIQKAYKELVGYCYDDKPIDFTEVIGYLGEVLND